MIPRASEVSAAVAVLDSEDYDTVQDMAKALVKVVAGELLKRETFVLVPNGTPFGYGPLFSAKDAEKAWRTEIGASYSAGAALVRVFPWSPPEIEKRGGVCACGHRVENHVVKNVRGGKTGRPIECGRTKCDCRGYQETA